MQKNTSKIHSKQFLEFAMKTKSWHPVERNGWIVKFSSYREYNILLLIVSQYTGQTLIRHFTHEDDAVKFINYVVDLDPSEEYNL